MVYEASVESQPEAGKRLLALVVSEHSVAWPPNRGVDLKWLRPPPPDGADVRKVDRVPFKSQLGIVAIVWTEPQNEPQLPRKPGEIKEFGRGATLLELLQDGGCVLIPHR